MSRIVIFGNSGSGKTTLARAIAEETGCLHVDLDSVAWIEGHDPPARKALSTSAREISEILNDRTDWVIEGCYSDLLDLVLPEATEVVFLNPGVEACVSNCRNRPWEPHKYASPEAQDANLDMLVEWIGRYYERSDEFSYRAHRAVFDGFGGKKREFTANRPLRRAEASGSS